MINQSDKREILTATLRCNCLVSGATWYVANRLTASFLLGNIAMARKLNRFESKVNPNQITDETKLPGKVIARFRNDYVHSGIRITFTDGTFIVVALDYGGCYYEGDRPDLAIVKELCKDESES